MAVDSGLLSFSRIFYRPIVALLVVGGKKEGNQEGSGAMAVFIEGLLEGHESPGTRSMVKAFMVLYILLSLFAGVSNCAAITHPHARIFELMASVAALLLLGMSLKYVQWYRQENMDPKFKRATMALICITIILDIACIMAFIDTMTASDAAPATHAPTFPPLTTGTGRPPTFPTGTIITTPHPLAGVETPLPIRYRF